MVKIVFMLKPSVNCPSSWQSKALRGLNFNLERFAIDFHPSWHPVQQVSKYIWFGPQRQNALSPELNSLLTQEELLALSAAKGNSDFY